MADHPQTRVCIISNSDPVEPIPGGIDSFVRGILQHAPSDISFQLLGVSTNGSQRPVRQWTECDVGGKPVNFFPVLQLDAVSQRPKIPVSLRFVLSLLRKRPKLDAQVLEFHRFELMLPFIRHAAAKTAFVHQNMNVIKAGSSDIRWKHAPKLYFWLEDTVVPKLNSLYTVREDAARDYRRRYPSLATHIQFCPTWFDPTRFSCLPSDERGRAAHSLREEFRFSQDTQVIISVGRLDHQKDPKLLLKGFEKLQQTQPGTRLVFVGDGILRLELENEIRKLDLVDKVILAGLRKPAQIARYLNGADAFCLSSVYEGMPISLLEALACGIPVVSTDVGEARRVVQPTNGILCADRRLETLADGLEHVLTHTYRETQTAATVQDYTPEKVLKPVYENYRRLQRAVAGS